MHDPLEGRTATDRKLFELMALLDEVAFSNFDTVQVGPFQGMKWQNKTHWIDGNNTCKLFGIYEFELYEAIERAISRQPSTVVNIGSAEGYYAIGLARRLPGVLVHAIDPSADAHAICGENANRNGVLVKLWPSIEMLGGLDGHPLFVVDCEGYEDDYLKPDNWPLLKDSDIIVECHDFLRDGVTERLIERFKDTHMVERIEVQALDTTKLFLQIPMSQIYRTLLFTEKRPMGTCWLAMWTKAKADPPLIKVYVRKDEAAEWQLYGQFDSDAAWRDVQNSPAWQAHCATGGYVKVETLR